MYVIVCVLLADGMHGRAKFTSIIRLVAVLMLANNVSVSCGIPMKIPHVAICATFDCQLHVDADLLAKVKWVIDHLNQLLQHVVFGWSAPSMATFITS